MLIVKRARARGVAVAPQHAPQRQCVLPRTNAVAVAPSDRFIFREVQTEGRVGRSGLDFEVGPAGRVGRLPKKTRLSSTLQAGYIIKLPEPPAARALVCCDFSIERPPQTFWAMVQASLDFCAGRGHVVRARFCPKTVSWPCSTPSHRRLVSIPGAEVVRFGCARPQLAARLAFVPTNAGQCSAIRSRHH